MGAAKTNLSLLSLKASSIVGLEAHDRAPDKLAIVDNVVCLRCQHALAEVLHVAQDDTVAFTRAVLLLGHGLDLQALDNGDWILFGIVWVVEDGAADMLV